VAFAAHRGFVHTPGTVRSPAPLAAPFPAWALAVALWAAWGCTASGATQVGVVPDGGAGALDAGGGDGAIDDPFDPDAACGHSIVETQRVPGSLLLLFDRSSSMSETPDGESPDFGDPSKWDRATGAIDDVLASASDELGAGLLLFPTGVGDACDVSLGAEVPHVEVAPLSSSRSAIRDALDTTGPSSGSGTAIFDALRAGYDYLDTLDTKGQRGLVLVTDGAETCDPDSREAVLTQAADEHADNNYLTFAVGLTQMNSDLSTLAYNGGTPRNDTCLPECTSPLCFGAADCPLTGECNQPVPGFPGFCGCDTDADCPDPLTCEGLPLIGMQCTGDPNCCHYNATASDFEAELGAALEAIADRFVDSCVFDVPRGSDPDAFDPALVNVGVTFEGEDRTVLRRSSDSTLDSWDYVDDSYETLIIQGPICDRLLAQPATVEIVLGCPTILI